MKLYVLGLVNLGVLGQMYTIEQNDVVCERNLATCKVICYNFNKKDEVANQCSVENLNFSCICAGGYIPSTHNNTFPAAVTRCQAEGNECKLKCGGEASCSSACELSHVCFPVEKYTLKENTTLSSNSSSTSTTISAIKSFGAPASNSSTDGDMLSYSSVSFSSSVHPILAVAYATLALLCIE